jgi:hypothetical protein
MVEGDKFELFIPSELAYGDSGSPPKIPGGSVLVFEIEILEILDKDSAVPAIKCDASTKENCDEKETSYIDKIGKWDAAKKESEMKRLGSIMAKDASSLKAELAEWMQRRQKILQQLVSQSDEL